MVRGAQIRAARAIIGLSRNELALRAHISLSSLNRLESDGSDIRRSTLVKVIYTLEEFGIVLINNSDGSFGVKQMNNLPK